MAYFGTFQDHEFQRQVREYYFVREGWAYKQLTRSHKRIVRGMSLWLMAGLIFFCLEHTMKMQTFILFLTGSFVFYLILDIWARQEIRAVPKLPVINQFIEEMMYLDPTEEEVLLLQDILGAYRRPGPRLNELLSHALTMHRLSRLGFIQDLCRYHRV